MPERPRYGWILGSGIGIIGWAVCAVVMWRWLGAYWGLLIPLAFLLFNIVDFTYQFYTTLRRKPHEDDPHHRRNDSS